MYLYFLQISSHIKTNSFFKMSIRVKEMVQLLKPRLTAKSKHVYNFIIKNEMNLVMRSSLCFTLPLKSVS